MNKKLYTSLIFSNLVVFKILSSNHRMYNLYTKFVKILEICKQMDGGEEQFFVDSMPIEVCRVQEENVVRRGVPAISRKLPTSVSVLRRIHTILAISYTPSVG